MSRLSFALCALLPITATAQEPPPVEAPVPVPPLIIGGANSVVVVRSVAPLDSLNSTFESLSFASAAPYSIGGSSDLLQTLHQPDIHRELELVEDQVKAVRKLQQEYSRKQQEVSKLSFKGGRFDRLAMEEMTERSKAMREEFQKKLEETLLPHQYTRLKQVALQNQMRYGASQTLASEKLREALEITPEQQKRIQEKSQEVAKRLQKQIEALRAEAKQEVLNELDAKQKAKLKELLGD